MLISFGGKNKEAYVAILVLLIEQKYGYTINIGYKNVDM